MRTLTPLLLLCFACNGPTSSDDDKDTEDLDDTEVTGDTDETDTPVGDCTTAEPPESLALTADAFPGLAAPAAWQEPDGCAATVGYEAAIGTTEGGNDVVDWTDVGTALQWQVQTELAEDVDHYISVRATDAEGNVSNAVSTPAFKVWTPAALTTGAALWLDARTGTFSDHGCTTASTTDGEVRCWQDRSGNDNHARLAPAVALRIPIQFDEPPTLDGEAWATAPSLDFHGGKVLLIEDADSLDLSANFSIFVVNDFQPPVTAAWGRPQFDDYPINKELSWELAYRNNVFAAAVYTSAPWQWGYTTRVQVRGHHLEVFQHLDTLWRFRSDGVLDHEQPPETGGGAPVANDSIVTLGGRESNSVRTYNASMAELLVVDGSLTDDEVEHIEQYLMRRWSIAMGTPVPDDTGAPVF